MFHKIATLIHSLTSRKPRQMKRESRPVQVAPVTLAQALDLSLALGDYRQVNYRW